MRYRLVPVLLMVAILVILSGCSFISGHGRREKASEQRVSLSDVPAPASATIERLTAGGKVEKIGREKKGDTVIYDVEAQVGGKHVEYDVDSSGAILTSEQEVPYESLPPAVRAAAEKHFGSSQRIEAFKEIEEGKTFYEVVGRKGTAKRELKLTDAGQIVEDEQD